MHANKYSSIYDIRAWGVPINLKGFNMKSRVFRDATACHSKVDNVGHLALSYCGRGEVRQGFSFALAPRHQSGDQRGQTNDAYWSMKSGNWLSFGNQYQTTYASPAPAPSPSPSLFRWVEFVCQTKRRGKWRVTRPKVEKEGGRGSRG